MDRNWINSLRISDEYERGVEEFIQFAQRNALIVVMMEQRSGVCALTI